MSKVCSSEDEEDKASHCCMSNLRVNFAEDFGWNFIISPVYFNPNYCAGDCKLGKIMPENEYAHVLQLSGIAPCCTPQKMGTLELLYMDEKENVVQGTLPKMMVERCGCGS